MKKIYVMAILMVSAAGCSHNDEAVNLGNTPTPLNVQTVGLASMTRAGITEEAFTGTESLGLFIFRGDGIEATGNDYNDGASLNSTVNVPYVRANESGAWTATQAIILSNVTGKVYSYYPYAAGDNNLDATKIPVSVAANQGTGQSDGKADVTEQADYMYSTTVENISNKNPSVTLTMNHALAMVSFKFVQTSENALKYPGEGKVSSIVLKNKANGTNVIKTVNGTMHIGTGVITVGNSTDAVSAADTDGGSITLSPNAEETLMDVTTTSVTAISVDRNDDYMYSGNVNGLSNSNPGVSFTMKHALTVIAVCVKKGTYTGTANLTKINIQSEGFGTSGTLNGTTGSLSSIQGTNTAIEQTVNITANTTGTTTNLLVVPNATLKGKPITFILTIDGKNYTVTSTPKTTDAYLQGNKYTYTLTLNGAGLSLSGVSIGQWGYVSNGDISIDMGYKVNVTGDFKDIAFSNTVSNGTLTMKALPTVNEKVVKAVTGSGNGTLSQSVDEDTGVRTITLSNLNSDYTLTFNGCETIGFWKNVSEGIYYVTHDKKPATEPAPTHIAVAYIKDGQRMMIEKYEAANPLYKEMASKHGSTNVASFSWGGSGTLQSGITAYPTVDGTNEQGYLRNENGTYSNTPNLSATVSTWTKGALSDWKGKENSEVIKTITTTGGTATQQKYTTMG